MANTKRRRCSGSVYGVHDLAERPHNPIDWLAAFSSAGHGTDTPNMKLIKELRVLIWKQTENWIKWRDFGLNRTPETCVVQLPSRLPVQVQVRNADVLEVASEYADLRAAVLNMVPHTLLEGVSGQDQELRKRICIGALILFVFWRNNANGIIR